MIGQDWHDYHAEVHDALVEALNEVTRCEDALYWFERGEGRMIAREETIAQWRTRLEVAEAQRDVAKANLERIDP